MSGVAVITGSADETRGVGRALAPLLQHGDVLALAGELGSGKTTFVQGLAAGLGVGEGVVSPTFTLTREYDGRLRLVHVDVYRLDRVHEVLDLGLEERGDDAVLVIEWGDVAVSVLGSEHLEVRLSPGPSGDAAERTISMTPAGRTWLDRVPALAAAVGAH